MSARRFWGPNRNASKSRAWAIQLSQPYYLISAPKIPIDDRLGMIIEYRGSSPPIQIVQPARTLFSNTLHARFR